MEKLNYSNDAFESGAGRIYSLLMKISLPSLPIGVLLMGIINSGVFANFENLAKPVRALFIAFVVFYVIPGFFVFPTVWMLRSWKTRSLKNCYVMAGRKSVEYHKVLDQAVGSQTENVYVATQIKKIDETKTKYIIKGNILEKSSGKQKSEVEIPKAFDNMELIKRAARYR